MPETVRRPHPAGKPGEVIFQPQINTDGTQIRRLFPSVFHLCRSVAAIRFNFLGQPELTGGQLSHPGGKSGPGGVELAATGGKSAQPAGESGQPGGELRQPGEELGHTGEGLCHADAELCHGGAELCQPAGESAQKGVEPARAGAEFCRYQRYPSRLSVATCEIGERPRLGNWAKIATTEACQPLGEGGY